MVSIGFYPSSVKRNLNVDTTSWRNQSNILIPESKQIFKQACDEVTLNDTQIINMNCEMKDIDRIKKDWNNVADI